MNKVRIYTDPSCNIPMRELEALNVGMFEFNVTYSGVEHKINTDWVDFTENQYITDMKNGNMPAFSRPPLGEWREKVEEDFKKGLDVLYVSISQKTTGSGQSINIISNLLKTDYPDRVVMTYDSKDIAGSVGYMVKAAANLAKEGLNINEITEKLNTMIKTSLTLCFPHNSDFFVGTKRGDSNSIQDTSYYAIYCDSEGVFKGTNASKDRNECLSKVDPTGYKNVSVIYTSDLELKIFDFLKGFKDLNVIDAGLMDSFNEAAMGPDTAIITFFN